MNAEIAIAGTRARTAVLLAALLLAALPLAGCGLGGGTKPDEYATYGLEFQLAQDSGKPLPWQLAIEPPVAADALASARIATRESDGSYGVLKGARWNERAPDLVQSALVRTFEDSGRLRGVGRSSAALQSDFVLLTELRAFEADYRGSGARARVVLSAKLARSSSREVVAARLFEREVGAGGTGSLAIATAFGKAVEQLAPEVRDWVFEAGAAARKPDSDANRAQ